MACVWAASALAGSGSSLSGYNRPGAVEAHVQAGVKGQTAGVSKVGSLPFTGLDLSLMAVVGLTLVLLGWRLRRTARRSI